MNRPCFSLGILLSSLAVCLLAVGSANSQTGIDMHTPPCLMCPYAGHTFSGLGIAALPEPTESAAAAAELPEAASLDASPSKSPVAVEEVDDDHAQYNSAECDFDYLNYEEADYQRLYEAVDPAASAGVAAAPSSDPAPAACPADDAVDHYDYDDYFAEINATDESVTDAPFVSNEDVDAFDFFDEEAFEPAATVQDRVVNDAELEAGIYDLRTSYDDTYDEVMAPTVEAPPVEAPAVQAPAGESEAFGWTDHCFGGYADAYRSEYRCDLADAYQVEAHAFFDHDGSDPSVEVNEPASEGVDADEAALLDAAAPAFSLVVEPYVALVMERVGTAWQEFSLDAIVAKTFREMVKVSDALADADVAPPAERSFEDYVDCHVEAWDCEPNVCEIDCFAPWEEAQPVGSGVTPSPDSAVDPIDLDAEVIDAAALDATKALIRDLRSRLNAARQSPPLR